MTSVTHKSKSHW